MKFRDYVNEIMNKKQLDFIASKVAEIDDLDALDMAMSALNKKLPMMKKMIEKNTSFKVTEIFQGGQESDPGLDLEDGYSLSMPSQNLIVLSHFDGRTFSHVEKGDLNKIIKYLKNVKR